jgi:2-polyprenyl-3-methyl-5-hydroxy-6-metoxy-1,4-benzoquinol methylase
MMEPTISTDSRFSIRQCPACGSDKRRPLFNLKANQFCSINTTYDKNFLKLLQLGENDSFPIDRCNACQFVYARMLPNADFLRAVYDNVISFPDCRGFSENDSSYVRRMNYLASMSMINCLEPPLKALDFGSGLGVTLRLLAAMSIEAVGYDPSPVRTEAVRRNDSVILDSLKDVTLRGPYDLIVCDNVLEHVPEPKQTLRFLSSVCKSGSILFLSVPSYEELDIRRQIAAIDEGAPIDLTLNPWEHLNYFTLEHLDRMLGDQGFVPLNSSELPGHVNIGLRPEKSRNNRVKNSLASAFRLLRYAATGKALRSCESVYYRYATP